MDTYHCTCTWLNYKLTPALSHTHTHTHTPAGQTTPTSTTSCPELRLSEGYNCLSSSDCSELQCQVPTSTVLVNGTANISLDHCDDPPLVNFYMEWFSGGNGSFRSISTVFRDDRDMMIGEGNIIRATVERSITTLSFSVSSLSPTHTHTLSVSLLYLSFSLSLSW